VAGKVTSVKKKKFGKRFSVNAMELGGGETFTTRLGEREWRCQRLLLPRQVAREESSGGVGGFSQM